MIAETWKLLGLLVGSAGTIIAAVAKVLDERERSRAMLPGAAAGPPRKRSLYISIAALCIAVLGFVVGFAGEMASQRKAVEAASKEADAAKRQAAETQHTLEGLSRVFSRFETISMELDSSLPLGAAPMADYRHKLENAVTSLVDEGAKAGTRRDGVLVMTSAAGVPDVFSVDFKCAPGPIEPDRTGNSYLRSSMPHVAIFKKPVNPKRFDSSSIDMLPDLNLIPAPSSGRMLLVKDPYGLEESDFLTNGALHYGRIDMPRTNWSPSGKIMSVKDLEGAQAIVYLPWYITAYPDMRDLWDATTLRKVALIINDQRIIIDVRQLITTQTSYGKVYSYEFSRLVDF